MFPVKFQKADEALNHHLRFLGRRTVAEGDFIHEEDRELFFCRDIESSPDQIRILFLDIVNSDTPFRVEHRGDGLEAGGLHATDLPAHDVGIRGVVRTGERIAVAVPE